MSALSEPLYELDQESKYYKNLKKRKDTQSQVDDIIEKIAETYGFESKDFAYYHAKHFGFMSGTSSVEKFREHLTKNSDRNGVYTFKKNTKFYKEISEKMNEVDSIN